MKNIVLSIAGFFLLSAQTYAGGGHCGGGHGCGHAVITGHSGSREFKKHKGEIILTNSDTLYGIIKFNQGSFKGRKVSFQKDSLSAVQLIAINKISQVKIYKSDTSLMLNKETYFYNINGNNHLWRILYNGSYTLCDDELYVDENPDFVGELYIQNDKGFHDLSKWYSLFAYSDLLRFINKQYDENLRWKDFNSKKNLLVYIAERDGKNGSVMK
jgi:hypothetical protein